MRSADEYAQKAEKAIAKTNDSHSTNSKIILQEAQVWALLAQAAAISEASKW